MKRVVITGMGAISSIGHDWPTMSARLKSLQNAIAYYPDWEKYEGLYTKLAAPVTDFTPPESYNRKVTRSMGRVALMSTVATERALQDAGLLGSPELKSGNTGVAYGSSIGSTPAFLDFIGMLQNHSTKGMNANSYIKMMGHTTAVNISVHFGLRGRIYTTSSACTSSSQAIGYSYEAIREGKQDIMLAGGAEELCPTIAAVFDTLFATSTRNDTPHLTPSPYGKDRDGLVIGEGACTLVLEELEHAKARGATIYAEIIGFGTNTDGSHVTQPNSETMEISMRLALQDANLPPEAIGYVNAHGTATDKGDIAESNAVARIFGHSAPMSTLKSYTGHTLGACGSLEAMTAIHCMNEEWFYPTINLGTPDPECGDLDYIMGDIRKISTEYVMSNNFAFGGINTSLILKRWH